MATMATMHMENEKGGIRREGSGKGIRMSIKEKLVEVLRRRGYLELHGSDEDGGNLKELEDAWMMTMPSYLGFEGINPLTVYFCYRPGGVLWLVVLEVHNTFGESHVYLLEIGKGEDPIDPSSSKKYDHRWTFPRAFHVSPFNDRQGFYTVSIKRPSHPPSLSIPASSSPPLPTISIHLHVPSSFPSSTSTQIQSRTSSLSSTTPTPGPLKLTALLRPVSSVPLTAPNLLWTLSRYPVGLLLSLPRILYQAWVLHYRKKLDVYIRPEPFVEDSGFGENVVRKEEEEEGKTEGKDDDDPGRRRIGGVRWQPPSLFESYTRTIVERFLIHRTMMTSRNDLTGLRVELAHAAGDLVEPRKVFCVRVDVNDVHEGGEVKSQTRTLTVTYLSPRIFTILFLCPSAYHALLYGSKTEGVFFVSDEELFLEVFASKPGSMISASGVGSDEPSMTQRLRSIPIPSYLLPSTSGIEIPPTHFLDSFITTSLLSPLLIITLLSLSTLEKWIFRMVRARVVKGDEPWTGWERARELVERGSGERESRDKRKEVVYKERKNVKKEEKTGYVGERYVGYGNAPRTVLGSVRSEI
ncbi:hypothetical protein K435DRAFT_757483 [Dendrothele bispora CBS 962.96]|uniref:DUF1365-domain-containing protein n=1 Tax=Dendrothele bispora (strain CBS 962.96) TaxID=1314807 RepID=A0A4S8LV00_DENBC|nr:hypothetical protein K435DRAFT_757483 [Dendrothele bispora CBS 962.96]